MIPGSAALNNSALLVVDVINSCAAEEYEDQERDIRYGRIRRMIPSLAAFIAAYRRLGGDGHAHHLRPLAGALPAGQHQRAVPARRNGTLLVKGYERGIRYLIVAGVFGDGCVLATICGGFSRGYHFIIAKDLIETTDDEDRQAIQRHLKERVWPLMYGPTL